MVPQNVYITAAGSYLPGRPVSNENIEAKLGLVAGQPSRYRKLVLRANRIKSRHYALDDEGRPTHLNEELAAEAILDALAHKGYTPADLDMLAVGTTMGDLLMPGFASMVHGRLGGPPLDILSPAGVCVAGMAAFKTAWLSLKAGQHRRAMAAAAEHPSVMLRGCRFESESRPARENGRKGESEGSFQFFNADFLRWMLSDGAGACLLETTPNHKGRSLRVEWIELRSYAGELETCMYWGSSAPKRPRPEDCWLSYSSAGEAEAAGLMVIRQDTELLGEHMIKVVAREARRLAERGLFEPGEITHFLPHISSYFFYDRLRDGLREEGIEIPQEKWFTNLATKGNTGSAAMYIMLEEAFNSGRFQPGDKILIMVPESGRFSVSYALLTCVDERN